MQKAEKIRIRILTPVHIGSGNKLTKGFDFFTTATSTYIVPLPVILAYYQTHPEHRFQLDQGRFPLEQIQQLRDPRIQRYETPCTTSEILEFIKTPDGIPYIPGSSIKGAIRTAVLSQLFHHLQPRQQSELLQTVQKNGRKSAAQEIEAQLLTTTDRNYARSKQNRDLFRTLIVGDARFAREDLDLYPVKSLELKSLEPQQPSDCQWMKDKHSRGRDFSTKDTVIYPELLAQDAEATFTLRLDSTIGAGNGRKLQRNGFPTSIGELFQMLNTHARRMYELETKFLKQCASFLNTAGADFLSVLREDVAVHFPSRQGTTRRCILRLGWGIGWDSITGAIAKTVPEQFKRIRFQFTLGSRGAPFPKTHKIVCTERMEPVSVLGWVLLERMGHD